MTKITLQDVASFTNETSALATVNNNSAIIETASDNFLSRDGTTPNQMNADLDMNGNQILNLSAPASGTEPVRLQDLNTIIGGGTIIAGVGKPSPAVSTDNAIVRWDGTNAASVQNSGVIISDLNNVTGSNFISITANPSVSIVPTGNSPATNTSFSVQSNAASVNVREFLGHFGLTSAIGSGGTAGNDKVSLYSGLVANSGTANVWSLNTLVTMSAGSGSYTAQGYELDFNNLNADRGAADGAAGLAPPAAYGLSITGASTFGSTAAMLISGSTNQWHRGIVLANASVQDSSFQDLINSTISLDIRGSHTYGLDLKNGGFSGAAIRLGFGTGISWRNQANSADIAVLTLSASTTEVAAANLYNSSNASNTTKTAALNFRGLDTINTDKLTAQIIASPVDVNWVGTDLVIKPRAADTIAETARFTSAAINLATGKTLQVNGTQVVSSRVTGWNAPTGTQTRGTFDAAATLATTAQTLVALIADLRTHGLIGT